MYQQHKIILLQNIIITDAYPFRILANPVLC